MSGGEAREGAAQVAGRDAAFLRRRGDGPTLVLLHGAGGNHRAWLPFVEAVPELDLLVPSLPGRCGSRGPPCASITDAARWVLALLEALGIERAVAAGHSFGGGVAIEMALLGQRAPIVGLVTLASGAKLRVHPTILQIVEQAAESGEPADTGRVAWRPDTPDTLVERVQSARRQTPPETALADWRASDAFDRMADLHRIEVPALVIGGDEDALTPPKYARYLHEHLPNGQLVMLPGAGHMLPLERPREVGTYVKKINFRVTNEEN